jgi:hypothetical protein
VDLDIACGEFIVLLGPSGSFEHAQPLRALRAVHAFHTSDQRLVSGHGWRDAGGWRRCTNAQVCPTANV